MSRPVTPSDSTPTLLCLQAGVGDLSQPQCVCCFERMIQVANTGVHHVDLPVASSPHAKQQHLVATYVEHRLPSRSQGREPFTHWLTFLAKQMQHHHQTVFAVESLQPDWLLDTPRHVYRWSVILACGLLSGLLVGMKTRIEPEEERTWSCHAAPRAAS